MTQRWEREIEAHKQKTDIRDLSSTEKEVRLFTCRHHHGGIIKCSVESVFALSCTMATAWSKRRVHFTHTPSAASDNIDNISSVSVEAARAERKTQERSPACRFSCVYTKHVGARVTRRRIDYKAERRGDSCTHAHRPTKTHRQSQNKHLGRTEPNRSQS